ncbi:MAG TPA: hypothetical protein VN370_11060 [Desulfitobacteriaceae bacterium]|jgi:epoxyqueuosine reductase QueG|nr:hypothetical protein [Desulfitobacteriaceae bacterium]
MDLNQEIYDIAKKNMITYFGVADLACENYFNEMENKEQISVCGLCLYVCPYGNK